MSTILDNPYQIYTDLNGYPMDNGYIYIGTVNLDPVTNPISVYWDTAGTIPAAQPLRTQNGYIVNAGSPAVAYVLAASYSLTLKDAGAVTVFNAPSVSPSGAGSGYAPLASPHFTGTPTTPTGTPGAATSQVASQAFVVNEVANVASSTVLNMSAVRSSTAGGRTTLTTRGYYTQADGGAATYYLDSADTTTADNGGDVLVGADGSRWKLCKGFVYSARQFGARGDSSYGVAGTDDTAALQRLIDYVSKTGTRGYIPAGRYRCTNQLSIHENCYLYGDGWKDVRDMTPLVGPNTRDWTQSKVIGTIIYADFFTGTAAQQIYVDGNSVTITDIEFEVNQPAPNATSWTPAAVPLAIYAFRNNYYEQGGNSLTLDNIMLRNHTNGIKMFGVARGYLNRIFGQIFGVGLDISHNGDVLRMENIHLNWSFFTGLGGPGTSGTCAYMDANATSLLLGRVDNPILTNFFCFGGLVGIHLYTDTITPDGGSTFRLQASNIGLDNIGIGVKLDDACSLLMSNFYVYNRSNIATSRGIYGVAVLGGGYVPQRINLVNGDFQGSQAEAIRLEVAGLTNLSNIQITDYNNSGGAYPGIAAFSGVKIQYANLSNTTLSTTPLTQAYGTGTITGGAPTGGVTAFNTRAGAVTFLTADITSALTTAPALLSNAATFRATGESTPAGGTGVEMNYSTSLDSGFLNSFDRTAGAYKDLVIGGRNVTFKTAASGNAASFDSTGQLILLYQPAISDNSNKAVTSAWVTSKIAAGGAGLTSFQGRTSAAAVLTTADVNGVLTSSSITGALGYTPLPTSNPSPSGLLDSSGTIRATGNSTPGSGTGVEMNYNAGTGFFNSFDRTGGVYKDVQLGGDNIIFKNNSGVVAQFTSGNEMFIGVASDQGAYKLQVNGQIWATSATIATSDSNLKENIESMGDATDIIKSLRAVTYTFKEHEELDFPTGTQVGFVAQEVQTALDGKAYAESIVHQGRYLGLSEAKLVPLLLKALQETEARVAALEALVVPH